MFVVARVLVTVVTPARFFYSQLRRFAILFRRRIVPVISSVGRTSIRDVWVIRVRQRIIPLPVGVSPEPPERAKTKSNIKSSRPGIAIISAVIVGKPVIPTVVMMRSVVVATESAVAKMVNAVEGVEDSILMDASDALASMNGVSTTLKTTTTMKSGVLC